jgi:hypothetical protein
MATVQEQAKELEQLRSQLASQAIETERLRRLAQERKESSVLEFSQGGALQQLPDSVVNYFIQSCKETIRALLMYAPEGKRKGGNLQLYRTIRSQAVDKFNSWLVSSGKQNWHVKSITLMGKEKVKQTDDDLVHVVFTAKGFKKGISLALARERGISPCGLLTSLVIHRSDLQ